MYSNSLLIKEIPRYLGQKKVWQIALKMCLQYQFFYVILYMTLDEVKYTDLKK